MSEEPQANEAEKEKTLAVQLPAKAFAFVALMATYEGHDTPEKWLLDHLEEEVSAFCEAMGDNERPELQNVFNGREEVFSAKEEAGSDKPVKVTVAFTPLAYKLLELVTVYEKAKSVEEWIVEACGSLVGAWGEGMERDEWERCFATDADSEKKEEA